MNDIIKFAEKFGHWNGQTIEMNDVGLKQFAAAIRAEERQAIELELLPLTRVGSVSQYVQGRWDFAEELQTVLKERGKQ